MKPVDQTRFNEEGNCLAAVFASLLEVPIEEVDFSCHLLGYDWYVHVNEKLKPFGVMYIGVGTCDDRHGRIQLNLPDAQYFIASGTTERHPTRHHAMIWQQQKERVVPIHDPHPSRAGLLTIEWIGMLVPRYSAESIAELAARRLADDPIVNNFTGERRSDIEREKREREAVPPGQLRKGITHTSWS